MQPRDLVALKRVGAPEPSRAKGRIMTAITDDANGPAILMRNNFVSLAASAALVLAAATTTAATMSGDRPTSTSERNGAAAQAKSGKEVSFLQKAAEGGKMEVELGNLALQRASNADVKTFAQRMVDDHTKANQQLEELASRKGITLKEREGAAAKQTMAKLSKLSGEAFDREYAKDMVKDHEKDVAEFRAATKLRDPDIKEFATQTLPTLQEHLEMAKKLPQTAATSRR